MPAGERSAGPDASATATSPRWKASTSRSRRASWWRCSGPSGCGKTTTLRLVAGFLEPEAGEIRVGDRCLSSAGVGRCRPSGGNMAMIFQSYALWPHMTVAQNVAYGLRFGGGSPSRSERRRVTDILSGRAARRATSDATRASSPAASSSGSRVARALVVEPEILLLDEPLSNLDANLREEMRFEIRRLHEAFAITTLYVTHDQAEAMVISDRIAVLERGRVVQIGTADGVSSSGRGRGSSPSSSGGRISSTASSPSPGWSCAAGCRCAWRPEAEARPTKVAVSIRPHAITLGRCRTAARRRGKRKSLGRHRPPRELSRRRCGLRGGDRGQRRHAAQVAAPSGRRVAPGTRVGLAVSVDACLPLPEA